MKATVKKQRYSTTKTSRRGRSGAVVKCIKNTKTGQKKVVLSDWQHLTKKDADIIVSLLNNPPAQNQATKEARELYLSIPQLG